MGSGNRDATWSASRRVAGNRAIKNPGTISFQGNFAPPERLWVSSSSFVGDVVFAGLRTGVSRQLKATFCKSRAEQINLYLVEDETAYSAKNPALMNLNVPLCGVRLSEPANFEISNRCQLHRFEDSDVCTSVLRASGQCEPSVSRPILLPSAVSGDINDRTGSLKAWPPAAAGTKD
jgi:hypothetical protein